MFQKSFFRNQSSSLGASILAIAYAGSYLLGLVRDRTLAYYFPTAIKETYDAAFQVPDLIFNLFAAGILSAAVFLPIFRELVDEKEDEKAYSLASTLMNLISIIIIGIGLVCFLAMPALTKLIVPGFDPERQVLVTNLSRIMLLSPLFFGISNVIGNILYSFKRFFSYGFAILLYNGSIILSIIFLQASLGIYSAAIGLVIGVFLHLVFRLIELSFTPFKYRFGIKLKSTEFWQLIKLAIPKTLGQLTYQGNLLIFTRIGSLLQAGSISAFNYARNIQSFPVSLFGISLASAVFPDLSSQAAGKEETKLADSLQKSIGQILFFTVPAAVGLAFLAGPIVKMILHTGEFTSRDADFTSTALVLFAISIPIESLVHLFARLFYAHKKVWTPVLISITAVGLNLILSYQLAFKLGWGAAGMALSFTIYTSFQLILLLIFTQLKLLKLPCRQLVQKLLKVCVASLLMYGTLALAERFISSENFLVKTLLMVTSGAISYLLAAFILKCEELAIIKKLLSR